MQKQELVPVMKRDCDFVHEPIGTRTGDVQHHSPSVASGALGGCRCKNSSSDAVSR
jgi:hypothetical protein